MKRITDWVHEGLSRALKPGDWALDATLGNGHDAQHLLCCVLPGGRVFGLDLQPEALEAARDLLGSPPEFLPLRADHAQLSHFLPAEARGHLRAIVFNLGYRPGGDHNLVTLPASTLSALDASLDWLAPGGCLSCTCYPGTTSGALEAQTVVSWFENLNPGIGAITRIASVGTREPGPFTLWLEKRTDS